MPLSSLLLFCVWQWALAMRWEHGPRLTIHSSRSRFAARLNSGVRPRSEVLLRTWHMRASGNYWFRAKRKGLGWGFPLKWQGWCALAAYVLVAVVFAVRFTLGTPAAIFYFQEIIATVLFLVVC